MQIEITNKFGKQVDKCNDRKIRKNLSLIINNIIKVNDLSGIKNLKAAKIFTE